VNLPNSPSGRPDEKHSIQITPLSRGNLTTIAVLHICRTRPMTTNQIQRQSVELQHALPRAKRARVKFTAEDDEILLDWVERVRERGLALWSERHWQELADKVSSQMDPEQR